MKEKQTIIKKIFELFNLQVLSLELEELIENGSKIILYTAFLNEEVEPEVLVIHEEKLNKELNLTNTIIKLSY